MESKAEERFRAVAAAVCARMGWDSKFKVEPVHSGFYAELYDLRKRAISFELWFDRSSGHGERRFWYGFSISPESAEEVRSAVSKFTGCKVQERRTKSPSNFALPLYEFEGKYRWCGIYPDNEDFRSLPVEIVRFAGGVLNELINGYSCGLSDADLRRFIRSRVAVRQGQTGFRKDLLKAYGKRCAISGCKAEQVLEAAHILPFRGEHTNLVANGLLLRADLHMLFDLGLLWVDEDYVVHVAGEIQYQEYKCFHKKPLRRPASKLHWPNTELLKRRHALLAEAKHRPLGPARKRS